jgi:hypothetical protein
MLWLDVKILDLKLEVKTLDEKGVPHDRTATA